jgi:hypothetical protein
MNLPIDPVWRLFGRGGKQDASDNGVIRKAFPRPSLKMAEKLWYEMAGTWGGRAVTESSVVLTGRMSAGPPLSGSGMDRGGTFMVGLQAVSMIDSRRCLCSSSNLSGIMGTDHVTETEGHLKRMKKFDLTSLVIILLCME